MSVDVFIGEVTLRKIERIRSLTDWTVAEIIYRGVTLIEREVSRTTATPWNIAVASGLIGCANGEGDLSSTYKQAFSESLNGQKCRVDRSLIGSFSLKQ